MPMDARFRTAKCSGVAFLYVEFCVSSFNKFEVVADTGALLIRLFEMISVTS